MRRWHYTLMNSMFFNCVYFYHNITSIAWVPDTWLICFVSCAIRRFSWFRSFLGLWRNLAIDSSSDFMWWRVNLFRHFFHKHSTYRSILLTKLLLIIFYLSFSIIFIYFEWCFLLSSSSTFFNHLLRNSSAADCTWVFISSLTSLCSFFLRLCWLPFPISLVTNTL